MSLIEKLIHLNRWRLDTLNTAEFEEEALPLWNEECPSDKKFCNSVAGMHKGKLPCHECWQRAPAGAHHSYQLYVSFSQEVEV